jgi:uncharacterized membrane protein
MQIIMDIGIIDLKTLGITDMALPDLNTQGAMAIGIAGPGISGSFFLLCAGCGHGCADIAYCMWRC